MKKEETNEFMNMTLEEKKAEIIKMVRDIPDDSSIHKELYEALKREMEGKEKDEQKHLRTRNPRRGICFSGRESSRTRSNAECR